MHQTHDVGDSRFRGRRRRDGGQNGLLSARVRAVAIKPFSRMFIGDRFWLYAAGNVTASPAGMVYGGTGATLAVAGVWDFYAGRAAVRDRVGSGPRGRG